ncbi:MAG: hypothetical protein CMQ33_03340 [Gammaproteobacteria bacterium]|nr:hypothetical protein [Gammaproteobacteria bacterium]
MIEEFFEQLIERGASLGTLKMRTPRPSRKLESIFKVKEVSKQDKRKDVFTHWIMKQTPKKDNA